jgi:copper resistance protein D
LLWFVRDFDLLALLLRALSFSLEALTLGAIFFLLVAARPSGLAADAQSHLRRIASRFALALVVIQFGLIATTSAELMSSAGLPFRELLSASYFLSGGIFAAASFALFLLLRFTARLIPSTACAAIALAASVSLSHAASRMDHRALLFAATALHHLGMAAWLGALPFLLIAIRLTTDGEVSLSLSRRFSTMALTSVCVLVLAGALLAWDYTGSWQGLYGSSYGILLSAKIILTALILVFGAANFTALRNIVGPYLFYLRRFSEVELILGFTVVLAAASLTAQSPPVDQMPQDMLSGRAVLARMTPRWPSFRTPDLAQLTPPTPLSVAVREATFTGGSASDFNDRAWSEYNHHWAGLIVLVVGLLAMVARLPHQRWAQHWPLLFLALAAFILLRADPECWPLGPRPFWRSFTAPDVLEHRLFALLIVLFALFEWSVPDASHGPPLVTSFLSSALPVVRCSSPTPTPLATELTKFLPNSAIPQSPSSPPSPEPLAGSNFASKSSPTPPIRPTPTPRPGKPAASQPASGPSASSSSASSSSITASPEDNSRTSSALS